MPRSEEIKEKAIKVLQIVFGFSEQNAKLCIAKNRSNINRSKIISLSHFFNYFKNIKEISYTFRFIGLVSVTESLYPKIKPNSERLKKFLTDNLDIQYKKQLLSSFIFSKDYKFQKSKIFPLRHIMFRDFVNDKKYRRRLRISNIQSQVKYCSKSLCRCSDWLNHSPNKIDAYMEILARKLYDIRNAVIHESNPSLILSDGGSLLDTHTLLKGPTYFRAYESDNITKQQFIDIISSGVKHFLLNNKL